MFDIKQGSFQIILYIFDWHFVWNNIYDKNFILQKEHEIVL